MRWETEKAFRDADLSARFLGDMKHGINDVKIAGGIDEKSKLEALMGFRTQAEEILKKMGDSISVALCEIDKKVDVGRDSDHAGSPPSVPAYKADEEVTKGITGQPNLGCEHLAKRLGPNELVCVKCYARL